MSGYARLRQDICSKDMLGQSSSKYARLGHVTSLLSRLRQVKAGEAIFKQSGPG
jgi:hypothetical protein